MDEMAEDERKAFKHYAKMTNDYYNEGNKKAGKEFEGMAKDELKHHMLINRRMKKMGCE